ncbi:hypothetical protein DICPUDRAFT_150691 [Dictyostelium purpureum]|uniref:Uncharacterized protein n=1 Tax=Dictyostelium purpureum TaxID=5786 RepID=F0ZH02_DICPU|nr:uncharacterized protein DICPUDRAFT_150691 [Dictyostelium purpureum]EGC36747.1 hypothetical protein DICPUDRAFT_150691 [Dictyostelium purpureum]|eukprot:XP_003286693.1 hypothetical protein DICPUDRAFT_150691 [Dictyostelium purpureum]
MSVYTFLTDQIKTLLTGKGDWSESLLSFLATLKNHCGSKIFGLLASAKHLRSGYAGIPSPSESSIARFTREPNCFYENEIISGIHTLRNDIDSSSAEKNKPYYVCVAVEEIDILKGLYSDVQRSRLIGLCNGYVDDEKIKEEWFTVPEYPNAENIFDRSDGVENNFVYYF